MTPHAHHERLHSMDALRAVAMLLGIVLHGQMAYMANVWPVWPADDPSGNIIFDFSFHLIHLFRMETFFMMAGVFACLLYAKYGARTVLLHRMKRIALPLFIGLFTVGPLCWFVFALGYNIRAPEEEQVSVALLMLGAPFGPWADGVVLYHLWFLYHLMILYFGALAIAALATRIAPIGKLAHLANDTLAWMIERHLLAPVLAGGAFIALLFQQGGIGGDIGVDTTASVYPVPFRVILYYSVFFGAGWILYRKRSLLDTLSKSWWVHLTIAAIFFGPRMMLLVRSVETGGDGVLLAGRAVNAVTTACLVVGFTGMFLRLLDRPSRTMRYISDSAYWLYIAHLPLVLLINFALLDVELGAIPKFLIVFVVSSALLLGSYHLFIRYTPIGTLLNGKRTRGELRAQTATTRPDPLPAGAAVE